ncbi:MAG TPA: hypothetical protein VLQ80_22330 [Candidatus Saccharimonadia bacterium]|jgi:hypothetical protein|nr:hypothetical protein [Candidatus Saccharimonadia bacterium]
MGGRPRGIEGGEHRTVFQIARGREQGGDVSPTQHHGQLLLVERIGHVLDHPGDPQGRVIKEPEGAHGLNEK